MLNNVDWSVCPDCRGINAAMFNSLGGLDFNVECRECGFVHMVGEYEQIFISNFVSPDSNRRSFIEDENPELYFAIGQDCCPLCAAHNFVYIDPANHATGIICLACGQISSKPHSAIDRGGDYESN